MLFCGTNIEADRKTQVGLVYRTKGGEKPQGHLDNIRYGQVLKVELGSQHQNSQRTGGRDEKYITIRVPWTPSKYCTFCESAIVKGSFYVV